MANATLRRDIPTGEETWRGHRKIRKARINCIVERDHVLFSSFSPGSGARCLFIVIHRPS